MPPSGIKNSTHEYEVAGSDQDLDELDLLHVHQPGSSSALASPNSHSLNLLSRAYDPPPSLYEVAKEEARQLSDKSNNEPSVQSSSLNPPEHLPRHQPPKHVKRVLFVGGTALLGLAYLIMFTATKGTRYDHDVQLNVILMISDGFGPASEAYARGFVHHLNNLTDEKQKLFERWTFSDDNTPEQLQPDTMAHLPLDPLLVGSSRTRSSNSLVTDSAAGATAFACGIKTYNGAISVEPAKQKPCGTILEAAKHRGYLTGLVATSRITHATPACFYSHVVDRDMESEIAPFLIGKGPLGATVDLAFGGGRGFFIPKSYKGSSRSDDEDLLSLATSKYSFNLLNDTQSFEKQWNGGNGQIKTPVLGLFNDDHMNYEIDRVSLDGTDQREPSLRNMSLAALQTLSSEARRKSAHGFFLMIEGSRIDMAAHSNDPVGHLYDILAYQETVRTVKTWVDQANKAGWPTLMISVSDHETGGLALGRQLGNAYPEYAWYPDVLVNTTHSTAWLGSLMRNQTQPISRSFVVDLILRDNLGIQDASEKEIEELLTKAANGNVDYTLADMVSRRAQLGWSTHGHSGVDVNLYAYPPELTQDLRGNVENTQIGKFITDAMQIDLKIITTDLNRLAKSWHVTNDSPQASDRLKLKQYSHEF